MTPARWLIGRKNSTECIIIHHHPKVIYHAPIKQLVIKMNNDDENTLPSEYSFRVCCRCSTKEWWCNLAHHHLSISIHILACHLFMRSGCNLALAGTHNSYLPQSTSGGRMPFMLLRHPTCCAANKRKWLFNDWRCERFFFFIFICTERGRERERG